MTLRKYWIAAATAGMLTLGAVAQISASGSGSGSASVTSGQASASQSAQTSGAVANMNFSAALSSGTTMQAELSKSVDAKKAKSGDPVEARLTQDVKSDGKVVLHKGSKLVGHVTQAQARTKEDAESKLGVMFDKAVLGKGEEIAFTGLILAIAPPREGGPSIAGDPGSLSSAPSVGGQPFGAGHSMGGPSASSAPAVNSTVGNDAGANGTLTPASRGAVDMPGVILGLAAGQGSVIRSTARNVKLESGTQMILQIAGSAAANKQ
jgi:hypothetical protein